MSHYLIKGHLGVESHHFRRYNENVNSGEVWLTTIKNTLISVGKPNLFIATSLDRPKHVQNSIKKNTLKDLYIQEWNAKIQDSSKGKNYSIYKKEMGLERYLLIFTLSFFFHSAGFEQVTTGYL